MESLKIYNPNTIDKAKSYMKNNSNFKLLAGGTDLVLELRKNKLNYNSIVSLRKILELKKIEEDKNSIYIGSMVTFTDLNESPIISRNYNSLLDCSKTMGSLQIRNVATVGGNISNAGSAADVVPCIISLDGVLVIDSEYGIREVSCEKYFNDYEKEKIKEYEILVQIIIPKTEKKSGYYKLGKRNSLAIARVSTAISLVLKESKINNINICLGAVGRYPFRAYELEKAAMSHEVKWLYSEEALNYLERAVEKSIGTRKTMPFKRDAIKGVFKRALDSALK
ncbi:MAG: FAD binding domain-containing protein [Clostridium sp.]